MTPNTLIDEILRRPVEQQLRLRGTRWITSLCRRQTSPCPGGSAPNRIAASPIPLGGRRPVASSSRPA